jgi:hypothetical protein
MLYESKILASQLQLDSFHRRHLCDFVELFIPRSEKDGGPINH